MGQAVSLKSKKQKLRKGSWVKERDVSGKKKRWGERPGERSNQRTDPIVAIFVILDRRAQGGERGEKWAA